MSYLKNKSEFNLDSAKVLIDDHNYYAPSVHCSYYGCFQYIKSKLNEVGKTYDEIERDITSSRQSNMRTLHSHSYPIKLLLDLLAEKTDIYYRKSVKDKIKKLKIFREISDYHNEEVDYAKSKTALNLSIEIIKMINNKL